MRPCTPSNGRWHRLKRPWGDYARGCGRHSGGAGTGQPRPRCLKQGTAQDGVVIRPSSSSCVRPWAARRRKRCISAQQPGCDRHQPDAAAQASGHACRSTAWYDFERLQALSDRQGGKRLMGHTRMQAAIPITVADRIASWRQPLDLYRLESRRSSGPRGLRCNSEVPQARWKSWATRPGPFRPISQTPRTRRCAAMGRASASRLVKIGDLLARISGSLAKWVRTWRCWPRWAVRSSSPAVAVPRPCRTSRTRLRQKCWSRSPASTPFRWRALSIPRA